MSFNFKIFQGSFCTSQIFTKHFLIVYMQRINMTLSVSRSIACVVADLLDRGEAGAEHEVDG